MLPYLFAFSRCKSVGFIFSPSFFHFLLLFLLLLTYVSTLYIPPPPPNPPSPLPQRNKAEVLRKPTCVKVCSPLSLPSLISLHRRQRTCYILVLN